VNLADAVSARNNLNGQEINGLVVKIGFAKVPPKIEPPLSVAEALANPIVLAGLVTGAAERVYGKLKCGSVDGSTAGDNESNVGGGNIFLI
jgi:hypothetical protein